MIKFRNEKDRIAFLVESGRVELMEVSLDDWPKDLGEIFFKKQRDRATQLVDFRKSQQSKRMWRQNRWKMMSSIHKFHRSIKGKRFHRSLGRFLATRVFAPKKMNTVVSLRAESLKAISSLRTHLYIESEFYMPFEESAEFMIFFEYAVPLLAQMENKLFEYRVEDIEADEIELLLRLVEQKEIRKACVSLGAEDHLIECYDQACVSDNTDGLYFFCESLSFPTPDDHEAELDETGT